MAQANKDAFDVLFRCNEVFVYLTGLLSDDRVWLRIGYDEDKKPCWTGQSSVATPAR